MDSILEQNADSSTNNFEQKGTYKRRGSGTLDFQDDGFDSCTAGVFEIDGILEQNADSEWAAIAGISREGQDNPY